MIKETLRLIFPRKCVGCGDVITPSMQICDMCRDKFIPIKPPFCFYCGRHIEDDTSDCCSECASKNHHYETGFAVFSYDSLVRKAMSDLKFNGNAENAEFFATEAVRVCGERIKAFAPDAIVPVPIHSSRRALRGYNQAELIAKPIAEALDIPYVSDLLIRNKKTAAQKILGSESRTVNLSNAFSCDGARYTYDTVSNLFKRVIVVDDIYTTGSTMENCTEALKKAGVREVGILSIAIGINYKN